MVPGLRPTPDGCNFRYGQPNQIRHFRHLFLRSRRSLHWHHRQRGEDLVAGIELHHQSGERPFPPDPGRASATIGQSSDRLVYYIWRDSCFGIRLSSSVVSLSGLMASRSSTARGTALSFRSRPRNFWAAATR